MEKLLTGTELRSSFSLYFNNDLHSEIYPDAGCNMLKFITTFLKVLGSATIKFYI